MCVFTCVICDQKSILITVFYCFLSVTGSDEVDEVDKGANVLNVSENFLTIIAVICGLVLVLIILIFAGCYVIPKITKG